MQNTVSILVPMDWREVHGRNQYTLDLLASCEASLSEVGYQLDVVHLYESETLTDSELFERYLEKVNPVAFILARVLHNDPVIDLLLRRSIPFVVFGNSEQTSRYPWVDIDNVGAFWLATRKCLDLGHTRIALLNGPANFSYAQLRREGYARALAQAGIELQSDLILNGEPTFAMGSVMTSYLLQQVERPTALICATDELALGALYACIDLGFEPGRDIAITGYGASSMAAQSSPRLATIGFNLNDVGTMLAQAVVLQLSDPKRSERPFQKMVSVEWVDGDSLNTAASCIPPDKQMTASSPDKALLSVRLANAALNRAQQIVHSGSWYFDAVTNLLTGSPAFFAIFGLSRQHSISLDSVHQLIAFEDLTRFQKAWDNAKAGRPFDVEVQVSVEASLRVVRWRGEFVCANHKLVCAEGAVQDVSDVADVRRGLIAARADAEKASLAKDQFLANMSHEIRTPIHAVLGLTEMLKRQVSHPNESVLVDKLFRSGENLLHIINNILLLSKVESESIQLEAYRFDMDKVVIDLQASVEGLIIDRPIRLIWPVIEPRWRYLIGDPVRLNQVLLNLLGNAAKFTASGEIELRIEACDEFEDRVLLKFSVRDSGIGIPQEKIEQLFDPFVQADSSVSRVYGGTGLGLTIVDRLVNLMGGKVQVESEVNKGSQFSFDVSFETTSASEAHQLDKDKLRVLIVDDSPSARLQAAEVVLELGWSATAVESGAQALDEIVRAPTAYDLLLLDYRMPGMSGLEVAKQLNMAAGKNDIIVLLLSASTADELPETRHHFTDGVLMKPLASNALLDAITDSMNGPSLKSYSDINNPSEAASIRGLKVLCVDDSQINLELLLDMLASIEVECLSATNGEEALNILQSNDEIELVITDIQMPHMDGLELTERIHQLSQYEHTPVIAVSAGIEADRRLDATSAGMAAYLLKPFGVEQLTHLIYEVVKPNNAGNVDTLVDHPLETSSQTTGTPLLFNSVGAKKSWSSDRSYLTQLKRFSIQYSDAKKLINLLDEEDYDAARHYTHTLAGVAGVLGLEQMVAFCRQIESSLLGLDVEQNRDKIDDLALRFSDVHSSSLQAIGAFCEERRGTNEITNSAPVSLGAFKQALNDFDPVAIERCLARGVETLAPSLLNEIEQAVSGFDYSQALKIIEQHTPSESVG